MNTNAFFFIEMSTIYSHLKPISSRLTVKKPQTHTLFAEKFSHQMRKAGCHRDLCSVDHPNTMKI